MKRLYGGTTIEAQMHSLHSDCKNVQKSALKSVNVQRTGKSFLQMFAFSFFDGSHICRFLPILRLPTVPRSHFRHLKTKAFILIINDLYLQILHSASESRFCVGKQILYRGDKALIGQRIILPEISDTIYKSKTTCFTFVQTIDYT